MKHRTLYAMIVGGASVGLVASFLQMLEKLALIKNDQASLPCDLNSVFSCSTVLNAWQSSLFGFPNAMMCIVFFALVLGVGLVGVSGGTLTRGLRVTMQGIALFFLGFGTWFLEQSTFAIGALCIFCLFCYAGLLAINAAWLRLNARGPRLKRLVESGFDLLLWVAIAMIVAVVMLLKFG